jgi:hypothetical protein
MPSPEGSGEQARPSGNDVIAPVLWLPFTSSTSDLGDGGASTSTDDKHQQEGPQRKIKRPGGHGSREGRKNTAERKGFAEFPYPQWAPVWFGGFCFLIFFQNR